MGVVHLVRLRRPAEGAQLVQGVLRTGGGVGTTDQALGGQAVAARRGAGSHAHQADVVEDGGFGQRRTGRQGCAGLVDVAEGGEVGQGLAIARHGSAAKLDAVAGGRGHFGHRFGGHHPVDQAAGVLLGRAQRGRTAIGCGARNHDGVVGGERHAVGVGAVALIEHVHGIAASRQRVAAPVFLGVHLRVHMLDGQAVREQSVVGCACSIGDVGGKERQRARRRAGGAGAIDLVHGVIGQVVNAHALAGIGQRHGAALLQAPLACGADGAIHAARAGRSAQHHARVGRVEAVGHLHGNHGALAARAIVEHGHIFTAWNQAFTRRHGASGRHVGAVQAAIAASGGAVQNAAVVGVQRVAAQLGRRGVGRVGIGGRGGQAQAGFADAARQQVLRGSGVALARSGGGVRRAADLRDACGQVIRGGVRAATRGQHRARQGRQRPLGDAVFLQIRSHHVVSSFFY